MIHGRLSIIGPVALLVLTAVPRAAAAQDPTTPSFSLASGHIFSSRERPAISLTYRRLDHLDFRVYRVNDPFAFFARLREPHVLGSEAPTVPQERTWLERIALWKAGRRAEVREFVRMQFSRQYRAARRDRADARRVVQRRTVNVNTFAQVPVLNAAQVVTTWREMVPPVRDADYRRIPLELPGSGVYVVEAVNAPLRAYTVVIVSDVSLITKTAPGQLLVFAANRFTSVPAAGCRVQVLADRQPAASGVTAADGTFETRVTAERPDDVVTIAQCERDVTASDPGAYTMRHPGRDLVGYIYTDRPVYRPGHIVRFKGVLRWRERGVVAPFDREPVEIAIADNDGKVLWRDRKAADEFGTINGTFTIPPTGALGFYTVRMTRGEQTASGTFEVQEYRKPEFDVAVRVPARFTLQGRSVSATIAARYYFGQPVAGGSVKYVIHRQPYYSPLRYDSESEGGDDVESGWFGGDEILNGAARLSDQGTADIAIVLPVEDYARDYTARIEARVTDASGREVAGATSTVATVGRFQVIARASRFVYAPGERATVDLRAVDYDGRPQGTVRLHILLERVEYAGRQDPTVTTIGQGDVETGTDGRAQWATTVPSQAGNYRILATAQTDGRTVSDLTYLWVPGRQRGTSDDTEQFLELIADRRSYQPGDTAKIVVRGAEFDAAVLVTKEHQQVGYHRVVRARTNEAIDVPIDEDDIGDSYVSIAFVKDDRVFRAERRLSVPATRHQLTVTATTDRPVVRPGEPGTFVLHVVDPSGAPVRAQLSVGLVDEAIYGVRPDSTPDPLRFFYRREFDAVGTDVSRYYSFVGYAGTEQLLLARRRRPLTLADFKADRPDRPRVRKDFPDTIYWAGDVTTGADGTARIRIDYPDSLTTWRLTVRAVTVATDVGSTLARTTTTKDVIVRVITPRFLTEGDQVIIPAIVHNYLPEATPIGVSLAADGLTAAAGAAPSASVQVASNGQQRVDYRFTASQVRPVTVTGKAITDAAGDAMQVALPVVPAGLQRDAGMSGSIVGAGERTVELTVPPGANASARSVRISLAPSLAGAMLGALDYLTSYPWGCTEQTLSSFVPNLLVLRTLADLKIAPTERLQSLDRQVRDGLKRLYDYQHDDGGWGWWKTDQNHPFMTAYALDGLLQAAEHDVIVDRGRLASAANALGQLYVKYPRAIPDLKAYETYVLARAAAQGRATAERGFSIKSALDELWSARGRMTASGRALLLLTLDQAKDRRGDALAADLIASAETRADVSWWAVPSDPLLGDIVDTSVEASALALRALAARDPRNPMLERVARWLMLNRSAGGYWISTKQTALALEGLLAFMRARGERPAPVSADVFVNNARVNTTTFDAAAIATPDPVRIESPAAAGANVVRIVTRGPGAVYYDATVRYYDRPAASERTGSRKLALTRTYARLAPVQTKDRIVYREMPFDGTARPGDLLLVRLAAAGSTDWRYLMLEDPIPAGTEPVENDSPYELEQRRSWQWGTSRELRDDRIVFFLDRFAAGRYDFSYMLKVTTPGVFSAMPAHISPMYVPDVSASSDTIIVSVAPEPQR